MEPPSVHGEQHDHHAVEERHKWIDRIAHVHRTIETHVDNFQWIQVEATEEPDS